MCLGVPGQVIGPMAGQPGLLRVSVGGRERSIQAVLLDGDPPGAGDWVLIHLGFALERMSEAEAAETIALAAELEQGPDPEASEAFPEPRTAADVATSSARAEGSAVR